MQTAETTATFWTDLKALCEACLCNWYFHDVLVFAILVILGLTAWRLGKRKFWQVAFREVFSRWTVIIAFSVLCIYLFIALLDSVGYHPLIRDENGKVRTDDKGHYVKDAAGLSLLDIICTPIRTSVEKTYSSPLADKQYTKDTMVNDKGEIVRDYPALSFPGRHLLGTDKVGNDVFYQGLKGIRTGIIIGFLTTLIIVPFAIILGVISGYFGGWVDDVIQYFYAVLSSIPAVLLIVAFMVIFGQGLTQLCIVLGISSWTGLCRVLRGETMKIREMEYIQACEAMGVSRFRIMASHIVPNIMHLVLISAVLSFSGRVMGEAVLTYIGIGVGANTMSWGTMASDAIGELSRDPAIFWKLLTSFVFMFELVLPANLFGDALRDALDPRLRTQ